eukprot:6182885-Pleurochrysis_carterae.AAC.3
MSKEPVRCDKRIYLISDLYQRDIESAQEFVRGYALDCSLPLVIANDSDSTIHAIANDGYDPEQCPPPTKADVDLEFGGNTAALTEAYRLEIERIDDLLGCCSRTLCSKFDINGTCSIADLPYNYTGVNWEGMYSGPLSIAAHFAETFLLQASSGLRFAWGKLSFDELRQIARLHEAVMWLGSNRNISVSRGSPMLAYILVTLEQAATGKRIFGAPHYASTGTLSAVFGHDFNLQYLRRLLDVNWLIDSFALDSASTGAVMRFELTRSFLGELHVKGELISASLDQQRNAAPLLPPGQPPGVALFLDMPYSQFRQTALNRIEQRCAPQPLRTALQSIRKAVQAEVGKEPFAVRLARFPWLFLSMGACFALGLTCLAVRRALIARGLSSRGLAQTTRESDVRAAYTLSDSGFQSIYYISHE